MNWYKNKHSGKFKQFPKGWLETITGKNQENKDWELISDEEANAYFDSFKENASGENVAKEPQKEPSPTDPKVTGGKPKPAPKEEADGM